MNVWSFDIVLVAVPIVALLGFATALVTRADRARWSTSVKVFFALFVVSLLVLAYHVATAPPPPP